MSRYQKLLPVRYLERKSPWFRQRTIIDISDLWKAVLTFHSKNHNHIIILLFCATPCIWMSLITFFLKIRSRFSPCWQGNTNWLVSMQYTLTNVNTKRAISHLYFIISIAVLHMLWATICATPRFTSILQITNLYSFVLYRLFHLWLYKEIDEIIEYYMRIFTALYYTNTMSSWL